MSSQVPAWFTGAIAERPVLSSRVVRGVAISSRAWGPAEAEGSVLLLHGGLAHSGWWDHVGPLLRSTARPRVVAVDFSGHGDSGWRSEYGFDVWADEIAEFIASSTCGPAPTVIGHSMGGLVALRLAIRYPELMAGTVAIDSPAPPRDVGEQTELTRRASAPLRTYPTMTEAVERFRLDPEQDSLPFVRRHVAEGSVRRVRDGWAWKFDPRIFAGQHFERDTLDRLAGRVCIIKAEHGTLGADVAPRIADSTTHGVVEIAGAGHHVMLDQPLALVAALRTLLAAWGPSASVEIEVNTH